MEDEARKRLIKFAIKYGIPVEELKAKLDRLEAKGELGAGLVKKLMGSELKKQEDTRSLYRMAAQELDASPTDEYLEVFPNIGKTDLYALRKKFAKLKIKNDRLQQRNIMITPEMWHTLVEATKEVLTDNTFKTSIDLATGQMVFSELLRVKNLETLDDTISHRKDCDALILRTIQFDFLNTPEDYESGKIKKYTKKELKKSSRSFERFLRAATKQDFDAIYEMAENCLNFSIHEYYLPYGFNKYGLERAVLLLRYDHCFERHKNSVMPKYYDLFYPTSVEEPHFHFNEGFGQIYKLLTSSGQGNFGSGYAIGLSNLYAYLGILNNLGDLPNEKRKFIENNDFGMPFLSKVQCATRGMTEVVESRATNQKIGSGDKPTTPKLAKYDENGREIKYYRIDDNHDDFGRKEGPLTELNECLVDLYLANSLDSQFLEFEMAYKFMDMVGGVEPRSLEEFRTYTSTPLSFEEELRKKKSSNDDNFNKKNI